MDTEEEEDILVAIYTDLINMVNAFIVIYRPNLRGIYQPSNRLIFSTGTYYKQLISEIFCFSRRLCWQMINTRLLKGNQLLNMTPERPGPATFLKKRLWHRCFPVKFVKFSRTPSSQSTSKQLLLRLIKCEIHIVRSSHQSCSIKKVVLKNFTKFTGKHPWQSLFFNKVSGVSLQL